MKTPPLKEATADGRPRGLFFEISTSDEEPAPGAGWSPHPGQANCPYSSRRRQVPRDWWDAPETVVRRGPMRQGSGFEFDIPEHLPGSPICPASPLHWGQGRAICVVSK